MFCNDCLINKGIAGQGFTRYTCVVCGQEGFWHNTNIPTVCPECSKRLLICERCGKDLVKEAVLKAKDKSNLLDVALDIGCSESSLYNYVTKGKVGPKVYNKIRKWYYNLNE